jgi:hypothetical protein
MESKHYQPRRMHVGTSSKILHHLVCGTPITLEVGTYVRRAPPGPGKTHLEYNLYLGGAGAEVGYSSGYTYVVCISGSGSYAGFLDSVKTLITESRLRGSPTIN